MKYGKHSRLNRTNLINMLFDKNPEAYSKGRYLELGCCDDANFNEVRAGHKVGVDSVKGGNWRGTTDEYFDLRPLITMPPGPERRAFMELHCLSWDVVFIDASHEHSQALRDAENALKVLAPYGTIVMHDCNPPTERFTEPDACWTAWKAFLELRQRPDLDTVCGDFDFGCGMIRRRRCRFPDSKIVVVPPLVLPKPVAELTYADLEANRAEWLNLADEDRIEEWVNI